VTRSAAVNETIRSLSQDNPNFSKLFKSITSDNGSEFAGLTEMLLGLSDVNFVHPYASWERGTNEKHNGILRRFILKGNSLKDHTVQQIKQMTNWMNHLPQKVLNYKTPTESILFHFNQILGTHSSLVPS
jgi:IS30 family transposase